MDQATDIYAKAAAELAAIDSQIASLEQRRIALRQFVELGRKLYQPTAIPPQDAQVSLADAKPGTSLKLALVARESSMKARVLALSREAIQERGPTHTRDLVTFIEDHGVVVTGADKNTTVSVILSRSDDFVNDRTRGWSLVKKNPQDAATSAGSSAA